MFKSLKRILKHKKQRKTYETKRNFISKTLGKLYTSQVKKQRKHG